MTWHLRFINGCWVRVFVAERGYQLPRFVFDQQRKTCERCLWFRSANSSFGGIELRCTMGGRTRTPAFVARLPDGICGPEARHFKPVECAA